MDPAQIPQGHDPAPSMVCVDAKRLRRSSLPADTASKVINAENSSSWSAPLLDNDDLLEEILLRLRPKPSSLVRASLICTRWRSILSDPKFLKRYRKHHRKPPLLGFFTGNRGTEHNFVPALNAKPNRIPAERFAIPRSSSPYDHWNFLGCRHGLGVLMHYYGREVVVWDPLTGQQHHVPFPPELRNTRGDIYWSWHAAVLCADDDDGHVHGDCFSSPFKLVLIAAGQTQAFACLYESVSGLWGNIVSTLTTTTIHEIRHSVLIGNALYCLFRGGDILAYDINGQILSHIEKPTEAYHTGLGFQLWRTNDVCGLGLAVMSKLGIHLWEFKMNSEGVFRWVLLPKIIQLEELFPQRIGSDHKKVYMVGYDEESNVIFLATYIGDFMLQLQSMRFRRISERNCWDIKMHYPYRNFYTAVKPSAM